MYFKFIRYVNDLQIYRLYALPYIEGNTPSSLVFPWSAIQVKARDVKIKWLVSMLAGNQVSETAAMSILLIFRIVDNSSVLLTSDLAFKRVNDGSVRDRLAVDV